MSDVLENFVDPYYDLTDETREGYQGLLTIATVSWNISLLPNEERAAAIKDALESMPKEARPGSEQLMHSLIARKEKYYSEYQRAIIDFELVDRGENWHISVSSTPAQEMPSSER